MEEDKKLENIQNVKKTKNKKIMFIIVAIILIMMILPWIITYTIVIFEEITSEGSAIDIDKFGAQEIDAYNSKFTASIGYNKQGTVVKTLCATVITNNSQWADDERLIIYIKMGDITGLDTREAWKNSDAIYEPMELSNMRNSIASWKRYDITAFYDEKGIIMGIGIIERTSSDITQNIINTNNI